MKRQKFLSILLVLSLVLVGILSATVPVTAQDATPAATIEAIDVEPVLVKYITSLPDGFYGIKPEDALKALSSEKKPFLLDLRDEKDFGEGGYIEGAVNISIRELTQNLDKLPAQDSPIIVYCGVGHRGGMALMVLRLLGYTDVKSIFGGFGGWTAAKLPVAKGLPAKPEVSGATPTYDKDLFAVLDKFMTTLPDGYLAAAPTVVLKSLSVDPKPVVFDVREPKELETSGYIDGSVNVPIRTLFDNLDKLPADKSAPIIVYCAIGHRGAMAMVTLQLLGYTNTKSIGGGFNNWVKNSLPIVKPVATPAP